MQPVARGPDNHSYMARWNVRDLSRRCTDRGSNPVLRSGAIEQRHGNLVSHRRSSDVPFAGARQVCSEEILDQLTRCRKRKWFTLVRPVFENDETTEIGTGRIELGKTGELRHRPRRVKRPEGSLKHFHRKNLQRCSSGFRRTPKLKEGFARVFGIVRKAPGGSNCRNAFDGGDVGRCNRHGSTEAVTDKRRRFLELRKQRHEQVLDVLTDIETCSVARLPPIEKQASPPHLRYFGRKRHLLVEIEHVRGIDERRHQDCRRSAPSVIAQDSRSNSSFDRPWRSCVQSRGPFVCGQSFKRLARQSRLPLAHHPYHFEKQRQRPWRAFMLRRTMLR